jgi:hypothetical protein
MKEGVAIEVWEIQVSTFVMNELNDLEVTSCPCNVNRTLSCLVNSAEVHLTYFNQSLDQVVVAMYQCFVYWKELATIRV